MQFRVLRLGLFQDGNVGVGVLPEGDEVLIRSGGQARPVAALFTFLFGVKG